MEIDSKPEVDGQARPPPDPAEDRARGGEEGKGRGLEEAPRTDRGRDRQAANANTPTSKKSGRPRRRRCRAPPHIKEEIDKLRAQMADLQRKGEFDKLAELQYGKLPQLEAQLKAGRESRRWRHGSEQAAAHPGRRRGNRRGGVARHRHPGQQDDAGRARQAAADGRQAARARGRPGRGRAPGLRRHPPLARRSVRPEPALRLLPVPRPDRRGQDRAVQGAGRVPVRFRGPPDPHRHERVHGEALGRAPDRRAARLCRLRGGRLSDRAGAPQALLA